MEINHDPVNHPSYYCGSKIEVIEYILDHSFDYLLGNVIKYVSRAGKKSPDTEIQDLEKARWYLDKKISQLKEKQGDGEAATDEDALRMFLTGGKSVFHRPDA